MWMPPLPHGMAKRWSKIMLSAAARCQGIEGKREQVMYADPFPSLHTSREVGLTQARVNNNGETPGRKRGKKVLL